MLLTKKQIKRYSRQIILKKIGPIGQKKLINSSVLIIGAGGLGSPTIMYLAGLGIGNIGIVDYDKVDLSNLHRQILFETKDLKKKKSKIASIKVKKINPDIKVNHFQERLTKKNISRIANKFNILIDGSDNFKTKFLLNDYSIKNKKILITGAINKFDGQVFTFNFKKKYSPCLRCFFQTIPSNDLLNCETGGIIGTIAGIIGSIQANEVIKETLKIGKSLCGYILIINALNLEFRKVKLNKRAKCICN
jgi:adenylyltransferase/sulfurtransferase